MDKVEKVILSVLGFFILVAMLAIFIHPHYKAKYYTARTGEPVTYGEAFWTDLDSSLHRVQVKP
jgi:hypothetical protein